MNSTTQFAADVLIVGAGPTGMTAAISLLTRGRKVVLIDKVKEGDNTSRAAVIYPGTLEALQPFGVAQLLAARGIATPRFSIRDRDRILMPIQLSDLPSSFPYALLVSQAVTESTLLQRLKQLGGEVLRPRTVVRIEQDSSGVAAILDDGQILRARFLVGADGAHSTVRKQSGLEFSGRNGGASYALADVHLTGGVPDDELVVYFSPEGHLVVLPLPGGIHRVVAHVPHAPENPDRMLFQQVLDRRGPAAQRSVIREVIWSSRFLTRHELAPAYCNGRVILAGDAAHVHSPLGGQGMNLGILDAVALGKALSDALLGASLDPLQRYESAQRAIARKVIAETSLLTRVATVPKGVRELRNAVIALLNRPIRTRLARSLSLLEYSGRAPEDPASGPPYQLAA